MANVAPQSRLDSDHQYLALDTLADMLRACGDHAFDTPAHKAEEIKKRADAWMRHLLMGGPHPDTGKTSDRDFIGVRRFVRDLRTSELAYVRSALTDFRTMISAVFGNIERVLLRDGEGDVQMKQSIARLRERSQKATLEELRREVQMVTTELSSLIGSREKRRNEEVAALGAELRQLHGRLQESRKNAETDALTGVHNRRAFDSFSDRVIEFDGMTGAPVSLLMIDVDNFKQLNDSLGHLIGDEALSTIGKALARAFLRKCDFVSRYGGEEFAVIVRDADAIEARRMAERARTAIGTIRIESNPGLSLSVSIGVATLHMPETKLEWLKRADDALLDAKRAGKNCCVISRV
ncbi:MAG TPA: GGDEF domain-containing protein [Polyangiales bacterium]|nr:GGDEF domain-containing protein [Polyangiales bacterium]